MKSADKYYLKINLENPNYRLFIDQGLSEFWNTLLDWQNNHIRFYQYLQRFTERTFCEIFSRGFLNMGSKNLYAFCHELGVSKKESKRGRIDLLIYNKKERIQYFVECKNYWALENEPETEQWKEKPTLSYYESVIRQAKDYSSTEKFFEKRKVYVALIFCRVEFSSDDFIQKWYYEESNLLPNEFYSFQLFDKSEKKIGVAVYGLINDTNP